MAAHVAHALVDDDEEKEETKEEVVDVGGVRVALRVGIGGATWTTGRLVCRHLAKYRARYAALAGARPLRVLELGAGTGVGGLFAAAAFEGASVVLTDLEDHLALLEANARRNGLGARATTALLDWFRPDTWGELRKGVDLVIATDSVKIDQCSAPGQATDCAYHERLYAPLAEVLAAACETAPAVILGVTRSDTGAAFFALLREKGLEYRLAEPPPDDYSALLAVAKAPGFDGRRDARGPPWPE